MVDVDKRTNTSGESEPTAPALAEDSSRANFDMGLNGSRDYKALLASGFVRENPGAPIPMAGASMDESAYGDLYGTNNLDTDVPAPVGEMTRRYNVPQGIHKDPMATWVNDGSVPPGTTGYAGMNVRPQGSNQGRTKQFVSGEND